VKNGVQQRELKVQYFQEKKKDLKKKKEMKEKKLYWGIGIQKRGKKFPVKCG
jgi:hypothetical protein